MSPKEQAQLLNSRYAQVVRDELQSIQNSNLTPVEIRNRLKKLLIGTIEKQLVKKDVLSNAAKVDRDLLPAKLISNSFSQLTSRWKVPEPEKIVNRKTYADGRTIPLEGETVTQVVPDLKGVNQTLKGQVYISNSGRMRVRVEDSTLGNDFPLNSHWAVEEKVNA